MYYGKIWAGVFDKQFEYFMKKIVTVPLLFFMRKSLNTDAVIDLKILLGSSNRGGVLESTRYTPYTLTSVTERFCIFPTVSYLYPLLPEIISKFLIRQKLCVLEILSYMFFFFLNPYLLIVFRDNAKCELNKQICIILYA